MNHVEVLERLEGVARGREVARDQARVETLEHVAAGVAGAERRGDPAGIDAARFGEDHRLGEHAIVREHQHLIDHLGDLAGTDRPHVRAGAEQLEHRQGRGHGRIFAADHDGERPRLGCRRAARDGGVDPAHAGLRLQPGGELPGRRHFRGRVIDQDLAGHRAVGDAVRAEHGGGEIVPGHDADVHDRARARDLGRGRGATHAVCLGARHLVRDQIVARDPMAAGDQSSGERLAHQSEADETEFSFALCHDCRPCAGSGGYPWAIVS